MEPSERAAILRAMTRLMDAPIQIMLDTRYYCECGRWLPCRHCPDDEGPDCD